MAGPLGVRQRVKITECLRGSGRWGLSDMWSSFFIGGCYASCVVARVPATDLPLTQFLF